MKVLYDFTLTEQDILVCALIEYSGMLKACGNYPRASVAEKLVNIIYPY